MTPPVLFLDIDLVLLSGRAGPPLVSRRLHATFAKSKGGEQAGRS